MKRIFVLAALAVATNATGSECAQRKINTPKDSMAMCLELGRAMRCDLPHRQTILDDAQRAGLIDRLDLGYITSRRPRIGMRACSVIAAFGKPKRINRTVVPGQELIQLVYDDEHYFYLANDRLIGWQE